jgi:hypothetical protein
VIDAHVALRGDGRFGVKCNAGPGKRQHAKIICAVANGDDIGGGQFEAGSDFIQAVELGLTAEEIAHCIDDKIATAGGGQRG